MKHKAVSFILVPAALALTGCAPAIEGDVNADPEIAALYAKTDFKMPTGGAVADEADSDDSADVPEDKEAAKMLAELKEEKVKAPDESAKLLEEIASIEVSAGGGKIASKALLGKTQRQIRDLLGNPKGSMASKSGDVWTYPGFYIEFNKEGVVSRAEITSAAARKTLQNSGGR